MQQVGREAKVVFLRVVGRGLVAWCHWMESTRNQRRCWKWSAGVSVREQLNRSSQ